MIRGGLLVWCFVRYSIVHAVHAISEVRWLYGSSENEKGSIHGMEWMKGRKETQYLPSIQLEKESPREGFGGGIFFKHDSIIFHRGFRL